MRWGGGALSFVLPVIAILIPVSPLDAGTNESFPPAPAAPEAPAVPSIAKETKPILYILPLGSDVAGDEINFARRALTGFYDVEVRILPPEPLPEASWYPARHRYRAERILDYLAARIPPDGYRILAITGRDISTTSRGHLDWGLLGLADYDHPVGVVSTYRCRTGPIDTAAARIRLGKVAVHEIGHTFGLSHCGTAGCIMNDPGGMVSACDRAVNLCARCREDLVARGEPLATRMQAPWEGVSLDAR